MKKDRLLWVDDEIDLLRPHILFLESKGYEVHTVSNGQDALDRCRETDYDLIFLDENMPGISGLETLAQIKDISPTVPVIMITKSEEEDIMDMAIGSKIADYLIKPVNPNQILLSLKKNLHRRDIVSEVAQTAYQQNFGKIGMQINDSLTADDWIELYRRLVYWELELEASDSPMSEMLSMQKTEANTAFAKFIKRNYLDWMKTMDPTRKGNVPQEAPMMSPDLMKRSIFPLLDQGEKVCFLVLDNFRYDQWRVVASVLHGIKFNLDNKHQKRNRDFNALLYFLKNRMNERTIRQELFFNGIIEKQELDEYTSLALHSYRQVINWLKKKATNEIQIRAGI